MKQVSKKRHAFILLSVMGIIAILGLLVYGLSLNVEMTYGQTRYAALQRELSQALRAVAELAVVDSAAFDKIVNSSKKFQLGDSKREIVVRAVKLPHVGVEGAGPFSGRFIALEAAEANKKPDLRKIALFSIPERGAPLTIMEFVATSGGSK